MAGSDIAAKVKAGLAKAQAAVSDGGNLVQLVVKQTIKDPINGDQVTETLAELKNAILKSFDKRLINGETIMESDRQLVCDGDTELLQGAVIQAYGKRYTVHNAGDKKPSEVRLAQICHLRLQ